MKRWNPTTTTNPPGEQGSSKLQYETVYETFLFGWTNNYVMHVHTQFQNQRKNWWQSPLILEGWHSEISEAWCSTQYEDFPREKEDAGDRHSTFQADFWKWVYACQVRDEWTKTRGVAVFVAAEFRFFPLPKGLNCFLTHGIKWCAEQWQHLQRSLQKLHFKDS